jgi:hypothetical protein
MTAREFEQAYLGRRVRWSPDDGGVYEGIVAESAHKTWPYVYVRLLIDCYLCWARPEQLELIEEQDNSPLPLPG